MASSAKVLLNSVSHCWLQRQQSELLPSSCMQSDQYRWCRRHPAQGQRATAGHPVSSVAADAVAAVAKTAPLLLLSAGLILLKVRSNAVHRSALDIRCASPGPRSVSCPCCQLQLSRSA